MPDQHSDQNGGTIEINNGRLIPRVNLMQKSGKFLAKGLLMEAMSVVDHFDMEMKMKKMQNSIIKPSIIPPTNGRH